MITVLPSCPVAARVSTMRFTPSSTASSDSSVRRYSVAMLVTSVDVNLGELRMRTGLSLTSASSKDMGRGSTTPL